MNTSTGSLTKPQKKTVFLCFLSFCAIGLFAQQKDTLEIGPRNLLLRYLPYGKSVYIVYYQQPQRAAEKMVLVKINVTSARRNGVPAVAIDQQWDADTVVHSAHTLLKLNDLSTLQHRFFWRRLGYSASYDFTNKEVSYEGTVAGSVRKKAKADFLESFEVYNLNWHADLVLFPLLPYREDRTFRIHFFDPGFGKMRTVFYSVTGTDVLRRSSGEKTDCWVLQLTLSDGLVGYQKFWISKSTHEVRKEEDGFNGTFRHKVKLVVGEFDCGNRFRQNTRLFPGHPAKNPIVMFESTCLA